jgi:hypothetical protein
MFPRSLHDYDAGVFLFLRRVNIQNRNMCCKNVTDARRLHVVVVFCNRLGAVSDCHLSSSFQTALSRKIFCSR